MCRKHRQKAGSPFKGSWREAPERLQQAAAKSRGLSANPIALAYLTVGVDAHIDPLGSCEFAEDYCKISAFCRADVGIGPYKGPSGTFSQRKALRNER